MSFFFLKIEICFYNYVVGALGSCSDPDIILEVLNFLLTREVRSQDVVFGLGVSREGREVAWNWFKVSLNFKLIILYYLLP